MENLEEWDVLVGRVKDRWDRSLLRIVPFSQTEKRFSNGSRLCALKKEGERVLLEIQQTRSKAGFVVCDCGLSSSDLAESLVGAQLFVHPSMRPLLPDNQFYPDELIGFALRGVDGVDLGVIEEILESPAHDIYVSEKAMVPDVPDFIEGIDGQKRTVWVKNAAQFLED